MPTKLQLYAYNIHTLKILEYIGKIGGIKRINQRKPKLRA